MADCPDSAFLTVTKAATKGNKSDRGEVDERAEREGYIKAWRQRFSDSLVPDRPSLVVFPTRTSSSTTRTPVAATATAIHTYICTQAPTQSQKQSQAQAQAHAPAPATTPPRPALPSAPLPQATQSVISSTAAPFVPSSFFRSGKAGHNTGAKGRDNEGQDKMTEDSLTYESEQEDIVAVFLKRLVDARFRYVGIYSPGDFQLRTYRVVVPALDNRRGRGYAGVQEEVLLETEERKDIDMLVGLIKELVGTANGPLAVRHIVNPKQGKDEGVRLVWRRRKKRAMNGDFPRSPEAPPTPESEPGSDVDKAINTEVCEADTMGAAEMGDWERRDRLIRAGKTVYAEGDEYGWRADAKMTLMPGLASPSPLGEGGSPDGSGAMTPRTVMAPWYIPDLSAVIPRKDKGEGSPIDTSPLSIEWPRLG